MEKKYFLAIPLFFLLFSFLFPFRGGIDRYFTQDDNASESTLASRLSIVPPFPGRECTCYISEGDFSAAGFLDGALLLNEKNSGFIPLNNRTSGKYQTVYSIAVSDDLDYLAVISGVEPKTLSVYQKKQDTWSLVRRLDLQNEERRGTYLAFSENMLLYEDILGISAVSLTTFRQYKLTFDGILKDVAFGPEHEYVWVLSGDDEGKSFVHIFLYDGRLIASAPYTGSGKLKAERLVEQ